MGQGYVYILTNDRKTVLYIGSTSDLIKRIYMHKQRLLEGFSKKYNCTNLVYFEVYSDLTEAEFREKKLKSYSRQKKTIQICKSNPTWRDLYFDLKCNH
jgi:putative endonuclease